MTDESNPVGRIVEDWVLVDAYGAFEQLDLVPARQDLIAAAIAQRTSDGE